MAVSRPKGLPFAERPVLDAFAGTGAFGLEALSRGASAAAFIENGREALAALRRNVGRSARKTGRRSSPATQPGRRAPRSPARWRFSTRPMGAGSRRRR